MNHPNPDTPLLRKIRSFVRRDGRMTDAQRRALQEYWPIIGLSRESGILDYSKAFGREAAHVLEIGFGSGYSLLAAAKAHPEHDFIGIETHQPGVGNLLLNISLEKVNNIRVYYADAVEVLQQCIPDASLEVVQIFFPDPWPKRRHHKRRLIQPEFVNLLATKLKKGGALHMATDWEDYGKQMMAVLSASPHYVNPFGENHYATRSSQRPLTTKFEKRGEMAGRKTWELQFVVR